MGLENIRSHNIGVFGAFFGGLPASTFFSELWSPDREKIDYESPIEFETQRIVTSRDNLSRGYNYEDFRLPVISYGIVNRLLSDLIGNGIGGVKKAQVYAHEYLGHPQFVSSYADFLNGTIDRGGQTSSDDSYAHIRKMVLREFGRTLAHLSAAELHLFDRPRQVKGNEELEGLAQSYHEAIPRVRKEMDAALDYIGY